MLDILFSSVFSQNKTVRCLFHFLVAFWYFIFFGLLKPYDTELKLINRYEDDGKGNMQSRSFGSFNYFEIFFSFLEVVLVGLTFYAYAFSNSDPVVNGLTLGTLILIVVTEILLMLLLFVIYLGLIKKCVKGLRDARRERNEKKENKWKTATNKVKKVNAITKVLPS